MSVRTAPVRLRSVVRPTKVRCHSCCDAWGLPMALCMTALTCYVARAWMSFQGFRTYATATVAVCMMMAYHLTGMMTLTARARLRHGAKNMRRCRTGYSPSIGTRNAKHASGNGRTDTRAHPLDAAPGNFQPYVGGAAQEDAAAYPRITPSTATGSCQGHAKCSEADTSRCVRHCVAVRSRTAATIASRTRGTPYDAPYGASCCWSRRVRVRSRPRAPRRARKRGGRTSRLRDVAEKR